MAAFDHIDGVDLHIAQVLNCGACRLGPAAKRRGFVEPLGAQPNTFGVGFSEREGQSAFARHGRATVVLVRAIQSAAPRGYSSLRFVAFTRSFHFSMSAWKNFLKFAWLSSKSAAPDFCSIARVSGCLSTASTSRAMRAPSSGEIDAGAKNPCHSVASYSGNPCSAMVGMSGAPA